MKVEGSLLVSVVVLMQVLHASALLSLLFPGPTAWNPEARMTVPELIRFNNYPFEQHEVLAPDGFINVLHRIPHGRSDSSSKSRIPVLLFHGILCSSAIWVENGPQQSLGFLLADRGFDVWLANQRGNTYSSKNIFYSSDDPRYWAFSFQNSALIDVPLMIDYILRTTGHSKLFYIGYSMGTTIGFTLLSTKKEYNDKIHAMIAMAPVADFQFNQNSLLNALFMSGVSGQSILDYFGNRGIDFKPLREIASPLCNDPVSINCLFAMTSISGDSIFQFNTTRVNVYLSHFPDRTSTQNLIHFGQIYRSGRFQAFDYGRERNLKIYRQSFPPRFNLNRISAPVGLYWSQSDTLADPVDALNINRKLRNVRHRKAISNIGFGHGSFIWSPTASIVLYPHIMSFMEGIARNSPFPRSVQNEI